MRLTRVGGRKDPVWRVVVADRRSPRDGRFIETLGRYNAQTDPSTIELDEERVRRLDEAVGRAPVRLRFEPGRDPELVAGCGGVDGAIAGLMAMVAAGVEGGTWDRLKACPREECEWAFYDKSKNSSGRWCSMESCGNIEKARAFRERRRGAGRH
jgi:ribosomal protein S16